MDTLRLVVAHKKVLPEVIVVPHVRVERTSIAGTHIEYEPDHNMAGVYARQLAEWMHHNVPGSFMGGFIQRYEELTKGDN